MLAGQRLLQRRRGAGLRGHGHLYRSSPRRKPPAPTPSAASSPWRTLIDDAENDRYTCPAGEHLTKGKVRSGPPR